MLSIGPHVIRNNLLLAPMAGVTDRPFRQLCYSLGAGLVVSEMITSDPSLRNSRKTQLRMNHQGEQGIRSVQIVGAEPEVLAQAAQFNIAQGAQIIDINMGCPAKKVANKAAGSALLRQPALVERILKSVVAAAEQTPVTLKIRTGWEPSQRNGVEIAKIAEQCGIAALTVHGRTRACFYRGVAEYDTIAAIKQQIAIPVIANGDIDSPEKAQQVLAYTKADAVMVGRGAQGKPWIFREIAHFLEYGERLAAPSLAEIHSIIVKHLAELHQFYGEVMGVRIARKHVGWYLAAFDPDKALQQRFNQLESTQQQMNLINAYFNQLGDQAA